MCLSSLYASDGNLGEKMNFPISLVGVADRHVPSDDDVSRDDDDALLFGLLCQRNAASFKAKRRASDDVTKPICRRENHQKFTRRLFQSKGDMRCGVSTNKLSPLDGEASD